MGKPRIPCNVVHELARVGVLKSADVVKLRHHGAITAACASDVRVEIIRKISLNGTRRRRR